MLVEARVDGEAVRGLRDRGALHVLLHVLEAVHKVGFIGVMEEELVAQRT